MDKSSAKTPAQPSASATPRRAEPVEPDPPIYSGPVTPSRGSVTVEELPAK